MKLYMFCENYNQTRISLELLNEEKSRSIEEIEFVNLGWDEDSEKWISAAFSEMGGKHPLKNIFSLAPSKLRGDFRKSRNASARGSILRMIVSDFFRPYDVDRSLLVQFNDASVRGAAVAAVCRNIGLRRLLIQDGFLNFESKTNRLSEVDQNYKWGASRPEYVGVWGSRMKSALIDRHQATPETITVAGVPNAGFSIPRHIARKPSGGTPRVLWADQAIIDQNKAKKEDWLAEFGAVAKALQPFETTLKLHPSSRERSQELLLEAAGEAAPPVLPLSSRLTSMAESYDVAVTYYSTVFLDCLANQIPCVVFKTSSIDIELPVIDHPLISYVSRLEDLAPAIEAAGALAADQDTPSSIFEYVEPEGSLETYRKIILDALGGAERAQLPGKSDVELDYLLDINARRLANQRILVLGGSFGTKIGVGKPIVALRKELRRLGLDLDFYLVASGYDDSVLKEIAFSDMVIINSFDVIRILSPEVIRKIGQVCRASGKPLIFYCHETQFVFDRLSMQSSGRVRAFIDTLVPFAHALAVSDQQAEWLATLGFEKIRVVYNTIGRFDAQAAAAVPDDPPIILMVGTRQKRKGLDLFSSTADMAKEAGFNWRFVWIGAHTSAAEGCRMSDAVEWVGHLSSEEVADWLRRSTVFFLSSIDDPLPLSVGEALSVGVPVLVYKDTGFAEFVALTGAGEVLTVHHAREAFSRLRQLVEHRDEYRVDRTAIEKLVGVEAFTRRVLVALGEISLSTSKYRILNRDSGAIALRKVREAEKAEKQAAARQLDAGAGNEAGAGDRMTTRGSSLPSSLWRMLNGIVRQATRLVRG